MLETPIKTFAVSPEVPSEPKKSVEIPHDTVAMVGKDAEGLSREQVLEILDRFSRGDWGEVSDVQKETNNLVNPEKGKDPEKRDYNLTGKYVFNNIDFGVYSLVRDGKTITLDIISERNYKDLKKGVLGKGVFVLKPEDSYN